MDRSAANIMQNGAYVAVGGNEGRAVDDSEVVLDTTDSDIMGVPAGRHVPSAVILVSVQLELPTKKGKSQPLHTGII